MKRIGAVLVVMSMLLACAVPAGASYVWHGESFLDDYYGVALASDVVNSSSITVTASDFTYTASGLPSGFSDYVYSNATQSTAKGWEGPASPFSASSSCSYSLPIPSDCNAVLFSGTFRPFIGNGWGSFAAPDSVYLLVNNQFRVDLSVSPGGSFTYPVVSFSLSPYAFSASITSLSFICDWTCPFASGTYTLAYSFLSDFTVSFSRDDSALVPDPPPVDPIGPGGNDGDNSGDNSDDGGSDDPVASEVALSVSGPTFSDFLSLSSSTSSGGVWVIDHTPSYRILTGVEYVDGVIKNKYTTVSEMTLPLMAPASFPSLTSSFNGSVLTVSMPSTTITANAPDRDGEIVSVENILTGRSGFAGPGSSALHYIDYVFDTSSLADGITDIEFNGALGLSAALTAGGATHEVTGGAFAILVNDGLSHIGTTDNTGKLQLTHYPYSSTSPIKTVTLRFTPNSPSVSVGSSSTSCKWSVSLDFSDFAISFLSASGSGGVVGDGGGSIDLSGFNDQNKGAQDSMGSYDQIEGEWTQNMADSWAELGVGDFQFDSGLVDGFALLTGIFNDVWRIFGLYSLIFIFPLLLGIVLTAIGRLSRTGGSKGGGE